MCGKKNARVSGDKQSGSSVVKREICEHISSIPAVSLFGRKSSTRMMAICSEPGMGRSDVITEILSHAANVGTAVDRRGLGSLDPNVAADIIVRVARKASRYPGKVIVAFDDIPPAGEACVRREARALRRLWEAEVPVVFSISPEALQLLDDLPECSFVSSLDLLVTSVSSARHGDAAYGLKLLTRGIPSLVESLGGAESRKDMASVPSYVMALGSLVDSSLRLSLTDEELRLRFAMLLLGKGEVSELNSVVGGVHVEALESMRRFAPLFGISEWLDSFRCLRAGSRALIDASLSTLRAMGALFPEVVVACARLLVEQGDFAQAAGVCALSDAREVMELVEEGGAGFVDAGETALVLHALDLGASGEGRLPSPPSRALRMALDALCNVAPGGVGCEPLGAQEGALPHGCREALMFADARLILRAEPLIASFPEDGWTHRGKRLLTHREAADLMVRGRFAPAMRVLVASPCPSGEKTVSASLLRMDIELARLFLCDPPNDVERDLAQARQVLGSASVRGLSGYPLVLEVIHLVLTGDPRGMSVAEEAVARAERRGDTLVQLVGLMAGCVFDLRDGAYARAGVRSMLAASIADKAGLDYLERISSLFGDIARFLLGERVSLDVDEQPLDDLEKVRSLVRNAIQAEDDAVEMEATDVPDVPHEALWLLLVLSDGMGEFSALLRREVPATWLQALSVAQAGSPIEVPGRALEVSLALDEPVVSGVRGISAREVRKMPVRLSLLGRFMVSVNGIRLDEKQLGHRNIASLLEYLALQQGSAVRRYQIVEQVWPNCDYALGFNKIYQATSALRAAFEGVGAHVTPFVSSRANKTMALNTNEIYCDVDEFRTCARAATDSMDDVHAVEMARRVEQLYRGDLVVPSVDATGYVTSLRDKFRALYADAMVAGAGAALRLGKRRTAARFANNALLADDKREDAVIVLVQALRASGRTAEAEQHYRRFARRLAQASQQPTSQLLRLAAGEGRSGGSAKAAAPAERVSRAM